MHLREQIFMIKNKKLGNPLEDDLSEEQDRQLRSVLVLLINTSVKNVMKPGAGRCGLIFQETAHRESHLKVYFILHRSCNQIILQTCTIMQLSVNLVVCF